MNGARQWPHQQCTETAPHVGHTHVNGGPRGGCGLPEWCPGREAVTPRRVSRPGPAFDSAGNWAEERE